MDLDYEVNKLMKEHEAMFEPNDSSQMVSI
jgi:hypothetical protein